MSSKSPVSSKSRGARPAVTCSGATDAGLHRSNNEDAFVATAKSGLCIVADGMGGLDRGEVASREAVAAIRKAFRRGVALPEALRLAHRHVRSLSGRADGQGMGTTVVAAALTGTAAGIVWVGDSRAYLWRDGKLKQLTRDHTVVQELVNRGVIKASQAASHPNRSIITRALGVRQIEDLEVDETRVELARGDRLLLCTDGLTSYLDEAAIEDELGAGRPDADTARRLIARTLAETDAADNVTVVVASVAG